MPRTAKYMLVYERANYLPIFSPGDNLPDYYIISRQGQIFSNMIGEWLQLIQNAKGYYVVSLQTIEGKRIQRRVHRLVKTTFDYFPGCENYQIDHIDGNKTNNCIENLEWVTPAENIRRAEEMNLRNHSRLFTNIEVLNIYNMILQGYSDEQISQVIPNANRQRIAEIIEGRAYKTIITPEMLQNMRDVRRAINKTKAHTNLSEDQLHKACQYISANPPGDLGQGRNNIKLQYVDNVLDFIGGDKNNLLQRDMIRRLLRQENNLDIISQYNL